jgi:hypothetical protein
MKKQKQHPPNIIAHHVKFRDTNWIDNRNCDVARASLCGQTQKLFFFSFRKGGELMGGFENLYVTCNVYTTPLKKKKIDFSYIDLPFKYNWTPGRNGAIKNGRGPPQRKRKKSIKIWLEKKNLFGVPLFDAEKKKIWFLLVSPLLGT